VRRRLGARAIGLVLFAAFALSNWPARAQATCLFRLGFAEVQRQMPEIVGACLEDERFNPRNGNAEQRTTGGLLVWRKADNWTVFTDGSTTWVNGPEGLVARPNGERFEWEAAELSVVVDSTPTPTTEALATIATPEPTTLAAASPTASNPSQDIHPDLMPAWQRLVGVPEIGAEMRVAVEKFRITLTFGQLPKSTWGRYLVSNATVILADRLKDERPEALAAELGHLIYRLRVVLENPNVVGKKECVRRIADAYVLQAKIWDAFWDGDGPEKSDLEKSISRSYSYYRKDGASGLRKAVENTEYYQEACEL
jgi:hypothetical protein